MSKPIPVNYSNKNVRKDLTPICAEDLDFDFARPNTTNMAFLLVPKCGSTSIRRTLPHLHATSRWKTRDFNVRIGVVRHPINRMASAWRYGWSMIPFEEWWAHVRTDPSWDFHTKPYADILKTDATEILRLEDIRVWWPRLRRQHPRDVDSDLQWHNASSVKDTIPPEILSHADEICEVYKADLNIWYHAQIG